VSATHTLRAIVAVATVLAPMVTAMLRAPDTDTTDNDAKLVATVVHPVSIVLTTKWYPGGGDCVGAAPSATSSFADAPPMTATIALVPVATAFTVATAGRTSTLNVES
jgi:hypothetical protein